MNLKIIYRKNLKMSPGKLAAQACHAALKMRPITYSSVIVLGYNDRKFWELVEAKKATTVQDAGRTEVEPGTVTVAAFYEQAITTSRQTDTGAQPS